MDQNRQPPGKVPPQNIEAEVSLLGSILIDDDVITAIADRIDSGDFYDRRHGTIYAAILKLYEQHKPIDLLTLSSALKDSEELESIGGSGYLTELTNAVPTAAHGEHYADIVAEKSMRRKLIKASEDIVKLSFHQNEGTVAEILEEAEKRIFAVSQRTTKQDLVSIEQILAEGFDRLDELHKNKGKLRGIKTGWKDLDNKTAGLQRSDLFILAARPAMGKTTFVLNLAQNVAVQEKQAVLFFSLEMSKDQLVDRMLSAQSGVDAWNIRTGNLSDDDFERLGASMGELSEAPIYIDDTPGITVMEMRTKARREAQKHPLGLIIIDYLQLMSGSRAGGEFNRVQEVSEISRGLKLIAREMNVPVIALSQLSRSVESRSPQIPQLSDLRESGSIEQDADLVAFLYREDYYNPETDRQHIADLIIAKHRNGPTGRIEFYFHPEKLKFVSLDSNH
ncbi:replicative DNA helicase [Candidatus Saccharibacteria bacterium]|jgi:replicative DNA helicase|nr:replicative DNA helicase [Candidatus Saccharibacteria bacterium]